MVEYKLKKDVVINGMDFKEGCVVNVPQRMVDEWETKPSSKQKKKDNKVSKDLVSESEDLATTNTYMGD